MILSDQTIWTKYLEKVGHGLVVAKEIKFVVLHRNELRKKDDEREQEDGGVAHGTEDLELKEHVVSSAGAEITGARDGRLLVLQNKRTA